MRVASCMDVVVAMLEPYLTAGEDALDSAGLEGGHIPGDSVLEHALFRIGLGMVRPIAVAHIWDPNELHANPVMQRLSGRAIYWRMKKVLSLDVPDLVAAFTACWAALWEIGEIAAGDESLVPHKGKLAGLIRQFIPRKPHPTGVKLYCLCDGDEAYCFWVYLYTNKQVMRGGRTSHAGCATPREMVFRWHNVLPPKSVVLADTYFGNHEIAEELADRGRGCIMLGTRRGDQVAPGSVGLAEGQTRSFYHSGRGYCLHLYKNPKVGGKAPRVVPVLSNLAFGGGVVRHARGYSIPTCIHAYRQSANGVDHFNQMSLQHREVGRNRTWSSAVRGHLLRMAMVNAFTTCKQLGLVDPDITLRRFQLEVMRAVSPEVPRAVDTVHCPVEAQGRPSCWLCGRRAKYRCSGCGRALYVGCFAGAHNV
jgi:hypothetical protein